MNFKTLINHSNWIQNKESWSIVLIPCLARRVGTGLEPGWVEEKNRERKTWCDPAGWPGDPIKSGQKPGCNPLTFFFILKRSCFDFFFKIDPVKTRNPNLKPDWPRSKNHVFGGSKYFLEIKVPGSIKHPFNWCYNIKRRVFLYPGKIFIST